MSSQLPRLRDLTLEKGIPRPREMDLSYQHGVIINDIVPKVPGLRRVKLTDCICWRRTNCWQPISPLDGRGIVRRILIQRSLEGMVDFGGFFASLVSPEELSDSRRSLLFPN
jgi:hypothetical protein